MNLQNKKDTLPFKTEPRHESGLLSDNVSIYNLLNKLQNVNNNNTKFSLDVNFSYNELIKKPYIKKAMLIGIVKNSVNEPFVVSFIVNKHTNEIQSIDVLYAVNAKKEPAGSLSPEVSTPPTGSAISIFNLLDYVNCYFLDILSESVLKHYGYSSKPEGNIGKSALFSRDVNIDEFDERDYNVINTTGLRGYASLKHEVMTWNDIKYLNQVRCISIEDRFYLYKMLDNETRNIIINKAKKRTRSEYNAIRRAYGRRFNGNTVSISELIKSNRNSSNDNSNIFRHEQEKFNNNDKFDNQKIRTKRESNGRGIAENDNNDNLSEEKYSRDVDYAKYAQHIVRFLKQI